MERRVGEGLLERWDCLTRLLGESGLYDLSRRAIVVTTQQLSTHAQTRCYKFHVMSQRVTLPLTTTTMSPNILDPSALLQSVPTLLPEDKKLGSQYDAIAVLLHTAMIALGFRLIGVDDSSFATSYDNNVLPSQWNTHTPNFTFRYRHDQSSLEFVLKLAKLGKRTLINAIAVEVC